MSQPAAYDRSFSFTNYQSANPSTPLPGNEVDTELNAVKTTIDQTLANLALIQRDDGALANVSVGRDQLKAEVTVGFNVPTAWAQNTPYTTADTVFFEAKFYRCITSHTSGGAFDAAKFELVADFSTIPVNAASAVTFTPAGNIAATNVQTALAELDAEKALLVHTHVSTDITDSTSAGRTLLTAANLAAQLAALGITNRYFQPGDWKFTDVIALETGWLWRDGSSYLRATYPALFAAITISTTGNTTNANPVVTNIPSTADMRAGMPISGTNVSGFATTIASVDSPTQITLSGNATGTGTSVALLIAPAGVADSTHFNVPDARGRAPVSRDDQGPAGTAGRVTIAGCGVLGTRLGVAGGAETHTLTTAQLASHTHTANVTDLGHAHGAGNQRTAGTITGAATQSIWYGTASPGDTNTASTTTGITVANVVAGGGAAHNNTQPFQVSNSIIKT